MAQIPRLYVEEQYRPGALLPCTAPQAHYMRRVLRLEDGAPLTLFNGKDGSWPARLQCSGKKDATILLGPAPDRAQAPVPDLWLLCAPLRQNRLDMLVEKATELGVARICPMMTLRTSVRQVNTERLRQIAIEAAEQCERDAIPDIAPLASLAEWLGSWPAERTLVIADESGQGAAAAEVLAASRMPLALGIGPEGGWSPEEHALLKSVPFVRKISLGPRILRAETAAIAALALMLAQCGDWDRRPRFAGAEG